MRKSNAPRSQTILQGTALTVAMRWTDRLIGVISTLILARLLVPEDFGIIAMASLAIGLADVMLDLGVNVALIQNRHATQAHFNTAWTLRLAQTSLATLLVLAAAPFAAEYFKNERIEPVLQVLAFSLLISGFENIGIVALQKEMQFGAEFRFMFLRRIAGFLVTVCAAWIMQSYWALVIGTLAGRTVGVILSYAMHPMRPRLSLDRFRDIFSVSQWMLARSIGAYLQGNLHRLLVGRWSPAATMGAYTLADEIAAMPSGELLSPLNRVLFPAFAAAKEDPSELKRLFLLAQGLQTLIAIPAAVGLALVADEAVRLLLGEKWLLAVPFLQVLALMNIAQALTTSSGYVLIVLGRVKSSVISMWLMIMLFATLALTVFAGAEALTIAWLRLGVGACGGIWISFWLLVRALPGLRYRDLFNTSVRPLLGAAVMALVLVFASPHLQMPLALVFGTKILLGAASYIGVIFVLWRLAGRLEGAETYLLKALRTLLGLRQAS